MKRAHSPWLQGYYRDQVRNAKHRLIWDGGWRANRVVQSCNGLLAALMKGEAGFSGILFWAVGEGASSWDRLMPSPKAEDDRLTQEIVRKPLSAEDIHYLDEANQMVEGPTARLQIGATFTLEDLGGEGIRSLREFGLFGGDATAAADSGWMIDYVIHPRIQVSAGMTLTRNLYLTFGLGGGGGGMEESVGGFGGALPVMSIDGVGKRFSSAFNSAGVSSLNDLIALDPLQAIASIPGVKLREFRVKARMVLGFRADLMPFAALSARSISDLLLADPETLAAEIGVPAVGASHVIQLQEALAVLQVALDDSALQDISLGALLSS